MDVARWLGDNWPKQTKPRTGLLRGDRHRLSGLAGPHSSEQPDWPLLDIVVPTDAPQCFYVGLRLVHCLLSYEWHTHRTDDKVGGQGHTTHAQTLGIGS
jgi:hypothetical protein